MTYEKVPSKIFFHTIFEYCYAQHAMDTAFPLIYYTDSCCVIILYFSDRRLAPRKQYTIKPVHKSKDFRCRATKLIENNQFYVIKKQKNQQFGVRKSGDMLMSALQHTPVPSSTLHDTEQEGALFAVYYATYYHAHINQPLSYKKKSSFFFFFQNCRPSQTCFFLQICGKRKILTHYFLASVTVSKFWKFFPWSTNSVIYNALTGSGKLKAECSSKSVLFSFIFFVFFERIWG